MFSYLAKKFEQLFDVEFLPGRVRWQNRRGLAPGLVEERSMVFLSRVNVEAIGSLGSKAALSDQTSSAMVPFVRFGRELTDGV